MNDTRAHITVRGRVQGVGFRYFAVRWAEKLRLSGWVQNNYDGSVESEVEGELSSVEEYVTQMKAGPRWSNVKDAEVEYRPFVGNYKNFEVKR